MRIKGSIAPDHPLMTMGYGSQKSELGVKEPRSLTVFRGASKTLSRVWVLQSIFETKLEGFLGTALGSLLNVCPVGLVKLSFTQVNL